MTAPRKRASPRLFLQGSALLLLAFGLALILAPRPFVALFGGVRTDANATFAQFLGTALLGDAYLNWHAPKFDAAALRIVMHMNIVALGAAVLVSTISMLLRSSTNVAEYLVLVMHVFFLGAFVAVLRDAARPVL